MKKIHYTANYLLNPSHPVTVNLIGCGGTGSQVLTCLARINYSLVALGHPGIRVHVYDNDEVTSANIGRQLFSQSDISLNKANVLTTRVNRFFGTDWTAIPFRYGEEDYSTANICISCVDSVASRKKIAKVNKNQDRVRRVDLEGQYYWLDFGNGRTTGQIVLGTLKDIEQPKTKEYEVVKSLLTVTELFDLSHVNEKDSGPSCSLAAALSKQDLFINSTLAQLGCALLWKLLSTGSIDYQGLYLNLDTIKVNPIKL